jgi:hypothetical protein
MMEADQQAAVPLSAGSASLSAHLAERDHTGRPRKNGNNPEKTGWIPGTPRDKRPLIYGETRLPVVAIHAMIPSSYR